VVGEGAGVVVAGQGQPVRGVFDVLVVAGDVAGEALFGLEELAQLSR
jgi:hypothetical protein